MKIDVKTWNEYIGKLRRINKRAAVEMEALLNRLSALPNLDRREETIIDYAFNLATRYGEAAGAAACEMYDAIASASGRNVPPADPADTATFAETAKAIRGTIKNQSERVVPNTVSRLVKQVGADTMLKNAARDGAQFAWVPHGDTCPFCIMLASNGWQYISKNTLKRGHAEHIHANCDCEYAVRFSEQDGVAGYDPDRYREIYDNADGNTWQQKLRSIQHDNYEANKDKINARRRELYAEKHGKQHKKQLATLQSNDIMNQRNVLNSLRNSNPLTDQEVENCMAYAESLGMPREKMAYSENYFTGYNENLDLLLIGTDAYPRTDLDHPNSMISYKGAMAHEIVGHREAFIRGHTLFKSGDVLDEAQASIRASRFAPGLSQKERQTLLDDAESRLRGAGYTLSEIEDRLDIWER